MTSPRTTIEKTAVKIFGRRLGCGKFSSQCVFRRDGCGIRAGESGRSGAYKLSENITAFSQTQSKYLLKPLNLAIDESI